MIINRIIPLIAAYFDSGIFTIFFVYVISLAFISTVPIIVRHIVSLFSR